ncbi:MAG: outer membrane protein transport protein [Thermoanaerobaculia bacterium]
MNRRALALLLLLSPAPLAATGFGLFQHGGRGVAEVGAFVARADDPSAVRTNPAGLARLDGFQFAAGLDFSAPEDEFAAGGRTDSAHHIIQFPPSLYASWKPKNLGLPLTFGLGLDSPYWTIENWDTALFPGRFDTLRQKATFFELRPSVAWAIDGKWSLGASLRYVRGAFETSFSTPASLPGSGGATFTSEINNEAESTADGVGVDVGIQYAASGWGFGALASSGASLDGNGDLISSPREPIADAQAAGSFATAYPGDSVKMDFALPPSASIGLWWGFSDAWKLEGDVVWSGWSAIDRTRIELGSGANSPLVGEPALDRQRDWKDVVSLRLGLEWTLSPQWTLGGGIAHEPSPVPTATIEPGFAQGDAMVVAFGASYNLPGLSFDAGYSYHTYSDRDADLAGVNSPVRGTFSSRAQVFSISARWRR